MYFSKVKTLFLFFIMFNLCCYLSHTYAASLDAEISSDKVALGETVNVTFHLTQVNNIQPDFSPLEKDFRIVGTQYSTAIQVINGRAQAQASWHVTLEPKKAGQLVIPEIDFGQMKSSARQLTVSDDEPENFSDSRNAAAFVKAELSTTSPYIESQLLYTFKLFYRTQFENPRILPPDIKDAVIAEVGKTKSYQTTINGKEFLVFEKTFAIFPQKAGELIIPPTQFRALQLEMPTSFYSDPFANITNKPIKLLTPSFRLQVQKIPNNFQGKTWLPAKNISLTEEWSSTSSSWEVGNPITRTITMKAQGLRADQLPDLNIDKISGVNVYADPPRRNNVLQENSIVGIWQQKITYLPNQVQSFLIPNVKLTWWDTQTNTAVETQLKPINIEVKAINHLSANSINNVSITPQVSDMKPAFHGTHEKISQGTPFYLSIWFWISIILLLVWMTTLGWILKKKIVKKINLHDTASSQETSILLTHKDFAKACEQNDPVLAQQFLLSWAKTQWKDPPHNLGKLCEMTNHESFKLELKNLEQALYSNQISQWNGHGLWVAYKKIRNTKQIEKSITSDPLPPLYPPTH